MTSFAYVLKWIESKKKNGTSHVILYIFLLGAILFGCKKETALDPTGSIGNYKTPAANAGADQTITLPLDSVFVDGSNSLDPNKKIKKYLWSPISGPSSCQIKQPENVTTWIKSLIKGIYQFELKVIDNNGNFTSDTVNVTVNLPDVPITVSCANRPEIITTLIPIGSLSQARINLQCGAAGSKILFAAGWVSTNHSSRVDIYDTITHSWSIAELTEPLRDGMTVASVGSKVMFAGGGDNDWIDVVSRVDIYDAATNSWSIAELSQARNYLTSVTVGNKVFFAGGGIWSNIHIGSNVVDIYDNTSNTWSTAALSDGRYELSAASVGNKVYFSGGLKNIYQVSDKIDIYDVSTGVWSTSNLKEPKASHASIAIGNKIMWVAGAKTSYWYGYNASDLVEIRDVTNNTETFDCITPKAQFTTVRQNDNLIFFTGISGPINKFDILNTTTNTWSVGVLPYSIRSCAIISVNNIIYVAGGEVNGSPSNQVWKLEF